MAPLLLGHRGARAFRQIPENTLDSFALCLRHGCDGFEFDVRLSADGEAVVCHDTSIGGMEIAYAVAKNLPVPTLEDVLRQFAERAFLDIELKVAGLEAVTLAKLRKHSPRKGYVVSSFLPEVLAAMLDLDSAVPQGLLCESRAQLRGWREVATEWVIPQAGLVNRELVEEVHAAGKRVMVWTVNRAAQMRELAAWGVDGIISDETEVMMSTVIN
ncbi:MAG: glycerophosphodiester phosphodiesterase [Terriglobales bacterium]